MFLSEFFEAGEGDNGEEGELEQVRCRYSSTFFLISKITSITVKLVLNINAKD